MTLLMSAAPGWAQSPPRVSRVGLSRVQDTSLLTVVLSRDLPPQVSPVLEKGAPRLIVDFPGSQPERLPDRMAGDQELIREVTVQTIPGRPGVRIILDVIPGRSYVYWRKVRPGPAGSTYFMLGLREEGQAPAYPPGLELPEREGPRAQYPAAGPAVAPEPSEARPGARRPGSQREFAARAEGGQPQTAPFQELAQVMPAASNLLSHLEKTGWQPEGQGNTDKTGSQRYLLINPQYPEMTVRLRHVPARGGASDITSVTLGTDRLQGSEVDKYRTMRAWSMGEIKKHFEDIGDYYDDGLKPLRIVLRERTKALALRQFEVFKQFLETGVSAEPQLADTVLKHIQERVNKRLEGAQYTVSENPLVLLSQVDFLYLRIYYVGR